MMRFFCYAVSAWRIPHHHDIGEYRIIGEFCIIMIAKVTRILAFAKRLMKAAPVG